MGNCNLARPNTVGEGPNGTSNSSGRRSAYMLPNFEGETGKVLYRYMSQNDFRTVESDTVLCPGCSRGSKLLGRFG